MRRPYQVTGLLCLLLAAFVGWQALKLRYYTSLGPGPGFFPFWLALLCAGLAAAMLLQATLRSNEPPGPGFYPTRAGALRVVAIVAGLLATFLAMEAIGFRLTMLVFNLAMLGVFGRRGWIETLLVAGAGSFGVYHVFVHWLNIPLPEGLF